VPTFKVDFSYFSPTVEPGLPLIKKADERVRKAGEVEENKRAR